MSLEPELLNLVFILVAALKFANWMFENPLDCDDSLPVTLHLAHGGVEVVEQSIK